MQNFTALHLLRGGAPAPHPLNRTPVNGIEGVIVPPVLRLAIVPEGVGMVFPMDMSAVV